MERNFFYEVEKSTRDRMKVDCLLYAGNNLEKGPRDFRAGRQASAKDQTNDAGRTPCCSSGRRTKNPSQHRVVGWG
jgi:hypothetical protein